MKYLQVSDLHLSNISPSEREYSFSVLREILNSAESNGCQGIFFCGDVFDSFEDLDTLRTDFIKHCQSYSGKIYFLPGNHEILRRSSDSKGFAMYDWSPKIHLLDKAPYSLLTVDDIEILAIPHQTNYSDLFLSPPPAKTKKWRIGLAHGTVTGMSFTGLDEETEDGGSYLDPSLIQTLDLDYLAIGHLHSTRGLDLGNCKIRYAGSSRVWRKSEFGERGGFIIQIREDGVDSERIVWKSAGLYRDIEIFLGIDGNPEEDINALLNTFHKEDYVNIRFRGTVESMENKIKFQNEVMKNYKDQFRILEIDSKSEEIQVIENLKDNQFVASFLQKMADLKPQMDEILWKQTKLNGIRLIVEGK